MTSARFVRFAHEAREPRPPALGARRHAWTERYRHQASEQRQS